jgi:hypothetical protein
MIMIISKDDMPTPMVLTIERMLIVLLMLFDERWSDQITDLFTIITTVCGWLLLELCAHSTMVASPA